MSSIPAVIESLLQKIRKIFIGSGFLIYRIKIRNDVQFVDLPKLNTNLQLQENIMRTISLILLCSAVQFFVTHNAYARQWQAELDFSLGAPQSEFNDQLNRLGVGLNFSGGYQFRETPFMIGLDLGFMNFGVEKREEPLSSTIPDLRVRVENSYNLGTGNIFVRFLAPDTVIRPYMDGLLGFNYFYTETVIKERGFGNDEPILRDTNFEDIALNYGFGGGLRIRIFDGSEADRDSEGFVPGVRSAHINLSGRYLFGREAEYLKKGSIRRENGEAFYDIQKSRTDLLYFKVGLGVVF